MKSDAQIKQDVLDELEWSPSIDHKQIGVLVKDGAVTLKGHVPSYWEKSTAVRITKQVDGVHAVVNDLDVELPSQHRLSDEGLAERISHVLRWNISLEGKNVRAEVKSGIVTLTGEIDWHYQRKNILRNIEHVSGVKNVIDRITLKPRASVGEVERRIKSALARHAEVEASKIRVTASNGTVTLKGEVESLDEMERIEDAAWAAPGVTNVVDNLRVV